MTHPCQDMSRFLGKVSPQEGGCWLWNGSRMANGYGQFSVSRNGQKLKWATHRYALTYLCRSGEAIPPGMMALHTCDVKHCVSPEHLYLGSRADNTRDAVDRGRCRRPPAVGENNPSAKLTALDVEKLRRLHAARGHTYKQLAALFGISKSQVYNVISGKHWGHPQ